METGYGLVDDYTARLLILLLLKVVDMEETHKQPTCTFQVRLAFDNAGNLLMD